MLLSLLLASPSAHAFCGTFVGAPGAELHNKASQVVMARQGRRTTLTLLPDFEGDLAQFGLIIPLPEVVTADDVRIASEASIKAVDEFSVPRQVKYTCDDVASQSRDKMYFGCADYALSGLEDYASSDTAGVTVEESFAVGEYEIVVLSAEESAGLLGWLDANGYAAPEGGEAILQEYIDAGVHFLAAKVSLEDIPDGRNWLSPLQMSYNSDNWVLPIRIGTISAGGEAQEVLIYTLTDESEGAAAISNYPEVFPEDECMLPTEDEFIASYLEELDASLGGQAGWVTEYSWSLTTNCDPCTSSQQGILPQDLEELGFEGYHGWLTRLRVRYTPAQATQDLSLYRTGRTDASQIRYIQYNPDLEYLFPVCGEGMVDNPGMCPEAANNAVISCGGGDRGLFAGGAAGLLLLLAARRRK